MKKLTEAKIIRIRELHKEGMKQIDLAKKFDVRQSTINYWLLTKEGRKSKNKKVIERFRNKSPEERSAIYKKRLPYLKKYMKTRYREDKEFRDKQISASMKYQERIREENGK